LKKVLLCYTEVLHYREEVFNRLADTCQLTVVHSGQAKTGEKPHYTEIVLPKYRFWKFVYQPGLLKMVRTGNYDAIIFFADLAWLSIILGFLTCPKSARRISWGFWRTGNWLADAARLWFAKIADNNIFYSQAAAKDFAVQGLVGSRIQVALNSVHVKNPSRDNSAVRDSILFVGSFNRRKGNEITLDAFFRLSSKNNNSLRMVFVGNGHEKSKIISLAARSCYAGRIEFHSGTDNAEMLRKYYRRAICSVSFGQAGLSVLQSFGHGVPFVTRSGAISGGEIENIVHGENGLLCDDTVEGLESALTILVESPSLSKEMGLNALNHYKNRASVDSMVEGFLCAIYGEDSRL
jgi:glycosyltransferase involved in cell wall biosynthesis